MCIRDRDVYDAYGDKKFFDYAVAYADTMIHQDGSIETYKLEEYNICLLYTSTLRFSGCEYGKTGIIAGTTASPL